MLFGLKNVRHFPKGNRPYHIVCRGTSSARTLGRSHRIFKNLPTTLNCPPKRADATAKCCRKQIVSKLVLFPKMMIYLGQVVNQALEGWRSRKQRRKCFKNCNHWQYIWRCAPFCVPARLSDGPYRTFREFPHPWRKHYGNINEIVPRN